MKVMIDTNIIISAAISPNGNAAKAFMKAVMPPYEPVVCDYIVDEVHRKFEEKFSKHTMELEAFLYSDFILRGFDDNLGELSVAARQGKNLPLPYTSCYLSASSYSAASTSGVTEPTWL